MQNGPAPIWKSLSGIPIPDLDGELLALVRSGRRCVHVGTDAKHRGAHTDFVTVIAVLDPGCGGRVFYRRERVRRSRSLAEQLFREVELSVQVATAVDGLLRDEPCAPITVHVDANENLRHRSSAYVQALAGTVRGYGFEVRVKPHSWCATHVADFVVKDKHQRAA